MPGSQTTQGQADARITAPAHFAFRQGNNVGTLIDNDFAAQWLAYTLPYRRFADTLAEACARLGAGVDRYSFTVMVKLPRFRGVELDLGDYGSVVTASIAAS